MSAPLVVNTVDGTVWTRREGTRGGEALYAPEKCGVCPSLLMATLTELAVQGIAGSADVLPVPVGSEPSAVEFRQKVFGPEPQAPKPIAYASRRTEAQLRLAHPSEKRRAAEWPWDMWCRKCLANLTSHRTEADALEAADRHVAVYHADAAEVHKLMAAGGLAELERLQKRVAELLSERHVTNEALSEAAEQLRADRDRIAKLEAARLLDGAEAAAMWDAVDHATPGHIFKYEYQRIVRAAFGAVGIALAGVDEEDEDEPEGPSADKLAALLAPTQVLREVPDGEHAARVHHTYRVGRDLPETGGAK